MNRLLVAALALAFAVTGAPAVLAKGGGGSQHSQAVSKQTNNASTKMIQSTDGVRHMRPGRQKPGKIK